MGFLVRASALFVGASRFKSYHASLLVEEGRQATLRSAQREIRATLKAAGHLLRQEQRFWRGRMADAKPAARPMVVPRFRTQGSFDYDLLVDPCQLPPQQIDLDDGVYFNVEHLDDGEPALVAKSLYEFVEEALTPLCRARGWQIVEKDCCVRIQIMVDGHIDLPIYSAPRLVTDALAVESFGARDVVIAKRSGDTYERLPPDKILLAYRDGTWTRSDPLLVKDWVEACVTRYGPDFRRVCRYLKGWRDHRWPSSALSSIALMAAVERALSEMEGRHRSMPDDHVLHDVAQRLPGILRAELPNPVLKDRRAILNDWSTESRTSILAGVDALAASLRGALTQTLDANTVVDRLRDALGDRIPYRPDAVDVVGSVAATVTAERPARVATPAVSSSTSG